LRVLTGRCGVSRFIQRYGVNIDGIASFCLANRRTTAPPLWSMRWETTGMSFNGVIRIHDFELFHAGPRSDVIFIGNLPTYAAIAWHFEKVVHQGREEKVFLDEVRAFARGPYAEALALGHNLPAAQVDAIAAKLAGYTGLTVPYIKEANLRVSPTRFRKELLRDQRIILGRYDARFEGTDVDAAGEAPGYDPSSTGIMGAFVSALHDYLDRELKYTTKEAYLPRAPTALQDWDHTHRPPGAAGPVPSQAPPMRDAYVAADLADAIRKNPRLRVLAANGLFDLATPFFITEYDLAHMQLEPKLRGNIEFTYYHSGHMIYLNVDALKQLKSDLAGFYSRAVEGGA
jgi:carboxypeptidase C (cathepsin A)